MSLSIEFVADFIFPAGFKLYGGVLPEPKYLKSGSWLLIATGNFPNIPNSFGCHAFEWFGGQSVASYVGKISDSRGTSESAENQVFVWAVEHDELRNIDICKIFRVVGATPVADDSNSAFE